VDHGPVKPAFGYRIDYRGRSVVLSGDTRPSENLVRNARGVDLLVHEVYALEIDLLQASPVERIIMDHHTSPEQAGEIFSRVKPRLALYSHIGRGSVSEATLLKRTRKTYAGPLRVGADLMAIEVGERITVLPRRPLWMNNGQAGSNPR
jgi:ribonuclease Z